MLRNSWLSELLKRRLVLLFKLNTMKTLLLILVLYSVNPVCSADLSIILAKHFSNTPSVAKVEDIFPVELSPSEKKLSKPQQLELRGYYAYGRNELSKISRGQVLPIIQQDFDLDGKKDFAAVIVDKTAGTLSLALFNDSRVLYQTEFPYHYTELMNNGAYPLSLIVGKEMKKVNSPCLRLISIGGSHEFLFFDKSKKDWVRMKADDRH